MDKLIRTTSKFKLPKDLSYPIGAEEISKQLVAVPQFQELTLTFLETSRTLKSDFIDDIKLRKNITIIRVRYQPAGSGPSMPRVDENNRYGESWGIYVFPVPSEKRSEARHALSVGGLKKIAEWLTATKNAESKSVPKQLNVRFDFMAKQIIYTTETTE